MQQVATYETVVRACEKLKGENQKITGRAVLAITGGSLGTILGHIKQWRQGVLCSPATHSEIPVDLQAAILRALELAQAEAAAKLKEETEQTISREVEALEGLSEAEQRIDYLSYKLVETEKQIIEERQTAETAAAVAVEKIASMVARIEELEIERRQLITAAEISRTEAAKAMLQVERADQATAKEETQLHNLKAEFADIQKEKVLAEKAVAVAEQKNQDQAEILAETRSNLVELKRESKEAIIEQKQEIQSLKKTITELEKKIAVLLVNKKTS